MSKEQSQCSCGEEADIHCDIKFSCKNCSEIVEKFSLEKPLKAAAIVAILGYGGSQFIDYAITDNRYPMDVEYQIIKSCVSNYDKPLRSSRYHKKQKVCLCAFEDTKNEISYIRYKVDEDGFLNAFAGNARNCNKT